VRHYSVTDLRRWSSENAALDIHSQIFYLIDESCQNAFSNRTEVGSTDKMSKSTQIDNTLTKHNGVKILF